MTPSRKVILVLHPTKAEALEYGIELSKRLIDHGFHVLSNSHRPLQGVERISHEDRNAPEASVLGSEIAVVLGGDGTILRAAEIVRGTGIPILGINLGNVGFLAEISRPSVDETFAAIVNKSYRGEERLSVAYRVIRDGVEVTSGWAFNETTIERSQSQMVELFVNIDSRPLSRWGCDGVICATPTGSTAYAFSAGGPVVWPEVNAFILLPLAAHALFAKPMVISPDSEIGIDVISKDALLSADGMRKFPLQQGDRVILSKDLTQISIVHIETATFTDRLVAKFKLPIEGWRSEQ